MCRDRPGLARAIAAGGLTPELERRIAASSARCAERLAQRPVPEFDANLPINARRDDIAAALRANQVIIVCGETGSGKTTQLPKICLELGRGAAGLIGHTQPRRIAARATASRIAQELKSELGRTVGYKIRFTDRVSPESYIKLMTDGILLAETQADAQLLQYDTLIIDEAHERSLNIDFLLGYVKQLLPKRPDLKLIVTSATLDAQRFSEHFADAPVIEVSGRLFPIEIRYRPVRDDAGSKDRDLSDAIVDAVDEVCRCGPGDVLVFLPGEREIREAAEALRKHHPPGMELLPLYARQSAQEQQRVFQAGKGRRVVLATNVAETSLTVPGIRYVVDSGLARIKRYSVRNKVEQLQVESIAQSAAKQRAGRCGRVASGICIRLYEEGDYDRRPAHTDPEVLRSSLAAVILRMQSLRLGAVEAFPFLDGPPPRAISDGYQLLAELGAVDEERQLTKTGAELARLPVDPRIARMVLAARDAGSLREVLVIAAALSVQDPRERPQETAGSADQAHAKWKDERSEFLAFLKLWQQFDEVWQHQSQRKQREWCRTHFLNYLRMREWRDVHAQLHVLAAEHGWRENERPAGYEQVHRALLAGLLGNIGCKAEDDAHYLGARGIKFFPHPGSTLAKKAGKWIVAAELVETTRLYGRCLAKIEPEWLEQVGAHLVKRHYYEPHWEKRAAQVAAFERATLYGLVLHARRRVAFGPLDPPLAREIFIREALVRGEVMDDYVARAPYFRHNRKLIADIEALEHRSRRPDVLVDEALIFAFYDALVPAGVCDLRGLDAWRRDAERDQPRLLFLEREQLMRHEAAGITTERFPKALAMHGRQYALNYHFAPGANDDGVTLNLPLAALNQISAARCEWLVPGMLEEKVLQLVKTLPQKIRHRLMPLQAYAADFASREHDQDVSLAKALVRDVEERAQLKLPIEAIRGENLPTHMHMNFRVVDQHGRVLGQSRDLAELRSRLGSQVEERFATAQATSESARGVTPGELRGLTSWSFGVLPELIEVTVDGRSAVGFPALVDDGASVTLRVFDTPEKAQAAHRFGLRRLFCLELKEQLRYVERNLPGLREMALQYAAWGGEAELKAQIIAATIDRTCMGEPWPADADAFAARKDEARPRVALVAQELARLIGAILAEHWALQKKLAALKAYPAVIEDIRSQCAGLLVKDFISAMPFERLQQYPRYLKAAAMRLDKLRADPVRDARLLNEWHALAKPFARERQVRLKSGVADAALEEFRWLLEELRVNLFAQELKTPVPVSVKRLTKIWETRQRM